jgi:uncharacterized membrane protein
MLKKQRNWIFGTMLVFGATALIAAFVLAIDEFTVLKNPHALLSCSINIVLNCGTVMQTWQAHAFGFPNMFIGLMAFPVVITVALISVTGVTMPRWFYIATNIGYLLGAVFAYWLFFNSLYAIQVLCPWCLVVTFSTTMILATITHYNLLQNTFGFKKALNFRINAFVTKGYSKMILISWIVLLIALVFIKFGSALFA